MRWTADCLSSEKREGTLGFLFLTDLKAYDVVAGKLASSSLSAAYGLLAVMPVLTIPMLLGGVTIWDVARLGLVLANTLFFAMSLAHFSMRTVKVAPLLAGFFTIRRTTSFQSAMWATIFLPIITSCNLRC